MTLTSLKYAAATSLAEAAAAAAAAAPAGCVCISVPYAAAHECARFHRNYLVAFLHLRRLPAVTGLFEILLTNSAKVTRGNEQ